MKPLAVVLVVLGLAGCGSHFTRSEEGPYPARFDLGYRPPPDEPESLFPSDIAVLNDSAIKRILSYQVTLPRSGRLAVLQLSEQRFTPWWQDADDFTKLNQELSDSMLVALRRSPRIGRAAVLPTMMVPRQRTIPFLREAAARYQADLLLGYRTSCQLFRRSRFLQKSQYRTVCSVEAILLDTRSGIVPFTVVTTHTQTFEKEKEDFETREAIVNAQFQATRDALGDVAAQLSDFLATVPETEP